MQFYVILSFCGSFGIFLMDVSIWGPLFQSIYVTILLP